MVHALIDLWLLDALALTAALIAVRTDQQALRIPNWLTFGTAALALVFWSLFAGVHGGLDKIALALLGALSVLVCFGALSCFELLGFGDTKLGAALGLCVGYPSSLQLIVCTLLCGGALALVAMARTRRWSLVSTTMQRAGALAALRLDRPGHAAHALPYAAAIALGTAWAIAARYWPEVAPL